MVDPTVAGSLKELTFQTLCTLMNYTLPYKQPLARLPQKTGKITLEATTLKMVLIY